MLEQWQEIKQMLIPELLGKFGHLNHSNRFVAVLKEENANSLTPTIYLTGIPENSVLIKADHDLTIPRYMDAGHGHEFRHRNDFVLLTRIDGKDMIISFELKSATAKHKSISKQFMGGDCLLDYLAALSRRFTRSPFSFDSTPATGIEHRYVLIYVPDKATKARFKNRFKLPRTVNNKPETFYSYAVAARRTSSFIVVPCSELIRL